MRGGIPNSEFRTQRGMMPVLIVTAYDSYTDDPRAAWADGYLIKNLITVEGLKQKINDLLG